MTVHAAKELEFPVVVVPEVHAPVGHRGASRFVADAAAGLDVRVWELDDRHPTASPAFRGRAAGDRRQAVFEEMRVFYVAVTRAQNHVVLVGADTGRVCGDRDREYGWQDEVLAARPALAPLGVRFETPPA